MEKINNGSINFHLQPRALIQALVFNLVLGGSGAWGAELVQFKNGDVVYAEEINNNFQILLDAITELENSVSSLTSTVRYHHPGASVPIERSFQFSGSIQRLEIPEGTNSARFELFGGQGGDASYGGLGGLLRATLTLDASTEVYLVIGGAGFDNDQLNGFNGGASEGGLAGGGATDIRIGGQSLSDRLLVAGGGGQRAFLGGTGFFQGGAGGGTVGGDGPSVEASTGGKGGTQESGGSGGTGDIRNGERGQLGLGGVGDDNVRGTRRCPHW